jgi:cell division septation protein DedD
MQRISTTSRLFCAALALTLAACATQPSSTTGASGSGGTAAAAKTPLPPYYSVQLLTAKSERAARANFGLAGNADFIRAEKRDGQYALRVGAWQSKAEATQAMERYKAQGIKDAYVIHCHTQPAFIQP